MARGPVNQACGANAEGPDTRVTLPQPVNRPHEHGHCGIRVAVGWRLDVPPLQNAAVGCNDASGDLGAANVKSDG
jgi:hypothetical protein